MIDFLFSLFFFLFVSLSYLTGLRCTHFRHNRLLSHLSLSKAERGGQLGTLGQRQVVLALEDAIELNEVAARVDGARLADFLALGGLRFAAARWWRGGGGGLFGGVCRVVVVVVAVRRQVDVDKMVGVGDGVVVVVVVVVDGRRCIDRVRNWRTGDHTAASATAVAVAVERAGRRRRRGHSWRRGERWQGRRWCRRAVDQRLHMIRRRRAVVVLMLLLMLLLLLLRFVEEIWRWLLLLLLLLH